MQNLSGTTLILGNGFVGSYYHSLHPSTTILTYRSHPISSSNSSFYLDVSNPSTWSNISTASFNAVLWTFPPSKPSSVEFFSTFLKNVPTIILSSIGAFNPPTDDMQIDESFKLEEGGRYETEEILRKEGATILYLGGIYGPGRDPLSWYQKGWIPNGETYLNLIHVKDICQIVEKVFEKFKPGENYIVTDGKPQRHKEIAKKLIAKGLLPESFAFPGGDAGRRSKIMINDKLMKELLGMDYKFEEFP